MWKKLGRYRWPVVFFILGIIFTLLRTFTSMGVPDGYYLVKDTQEMEAILDRGAVVLDLRDEQAFREGHLPDAIRIEAKSITAPKMEELTAGDVHHPVVLVSDKAQETKKYAQKIVRTGYDQVYDFGSLENWVSLIP